MSNIIQNGASTTVNLQTGEKLAVSAIDGTFSAVIRAGVGVGTALATNSLGGEYGPYVSPVVIQVSSSADGLVDFEVGTVPSLDYREAVTAVTNPLTGGVGKSTLNLFSPQADQSAMQSLFGGVESKIIAKSDGNNWYMLVPKSGARNTGLLYVIGKGKTSGDSGASSAGGATDSSYSLWRVLQVIETNLSLGCHHAPSATSGAWTAATQWTVPGSASGFGVGAWNAIKYFQTTEQNAYKEYSITVGINGKFSVGFLVGTGRATGVKVTLDGVDIDALSAVASATTFWIKEYTAAPGAHTVRVTKTDAAAGQLQIIGANCYLADQFPPGNSIDAMGYARTANRYKYTSNGAIEYAIQAAGTGKFSGSFHGGETAISQKITVDGVDVMGSASGSVFAGFDVRLDQSTSIDTTAGSVAVQSTTQFLRSGGHSFQATADCGSVPMSYFYTHMDVVEIGFNKLIYPLNLDLTTYADNSQIPLGPTEMTVLENQATGQRSATWSRQFETEYNSYGGARVWVSGGNYYKPYNGPAVDFPSGAQIGKIGWASQHAYF